MCGIRQLLQNIKINYTVNILYFMVKKVGNKISDE